MSSRGQTLALFALTLLLLVMMVMMTLSLGSKVRSRMDLQTVADTTAYSNAVATARTLNSIAVMNRVQVAHTASTIGTLSLISWATKYWRHVMTARDLFLTQMALFGAGVLMHCFPPPARPPCPICRNGLMRTGISSLLLTLYGDRVKNKLQADRQLFLNETVPRWRAGQGIFLSQASMYGAMLDKMNDPNQAFSKQFTDEAQLKATAPVTAAAPLNTKDLQGATYPNLTLQGAHPYHAAQLVMGSRGHPFVPERDSPGWKWSVDISIPWSLPGGLTWVEGDNLGRGYLNQGWTSDPNGPSFYGHPYGSYAHDEDDTTRTILLPPWSGCSLFGPIAFVVGIMGRGTGTARVGPMDHPGIHNGVQHSFQTFPPFYDYTSTSLLENDDLYGQPKNLSVMSKDVKASNDPWDMSFTFHFTPAGERIDFVDAPALLTGGKQVAIGAGVTYYSRPDHYTEPPNLFAPYWRSTLTRFTVDRPGRANPQRAAYDLDLVNALNATGQPEAANTYFELQNNGYLGFE